MFFSSQDKNPKVTQRLRKKFTKLLNRINKFVKIEKKVWMTQKRQNIN